MLVVRSRVPGLGGQLAGMGDEVSVVGDPHAAARGGDDLVAVEGEDAGLAKGEDFIASIHAGGLRR